MTAVTPYIDPRRPRQKRRPLKAWRHMQKLIADKEDTTQVFHIIEALNGNSIYRDFDRFLASENGPDLLKKRRYLPDILDDHAPLLELDENTVGRAYVAFMKREGLSAAGLVAESEITRAKYQQYDDDLLWYMNRLRDTHDLYHVLSGYGRDALGEDSLLGYTHSQHGGLGINFIAFMGNRQIAKEAPSQARVGAVLGEARKHGKLAQRIVDQDIVELLKEPLTAARERLNIQKPTLYRSALNVFSQHELDPALVAA